MMTELRFYIHGTEVRETFWVGFRDDGHWPGYNTFRIISKVDGDQVLSFANHKERNFEMNIYIH